MARMLDNTLELMERGVAKVVEAADVEMLTRQGWRIAKVLSDSRVEVVAEFVPVVCAGQSYPTQAQGTRALTVSTTRFLMFEDERSQLAKAAQLTAAREVTLNKAQGDLQEAQKALKDHVATEKRLETLRAAACAENASLSERYNETKKLKDRMEQDIAKIRAAVGELKMKEILGTP